MNDDAEKLKRTFAALFVCGDCGGRGKREYAVWPKLELRVSEAAEPLNEASAAYVPPRVEFRDCDTCRGTGCA